MHTFLQKDFLTSRCKCKTGKSTGSSCPRRPMWCPGAGATTWTAIRGPLGTLGRHRPPQDLRKGGTEVGATTFFTRYLPAAKKRKC